MTTIDRLRETVCRANLELAQSGLVFGTFGNLSAVDREAGVFAIKPSGVPYADLTPADMNGFVIDVFLFDFADP